MEFDLPKDQSSIIKVIGVGGGGSNAVNHMYNQGIKGVDFLICNTDNQALDLSPVPNQIQLGMALTEGRGAGSIPEVGKNAAYENVEELREILSKNTKMVFITAGMGGGTGTGAAPIIAEIAQELGILTVAIVTFPFTFEGKKRRLQAEQGLEELRQHVDTLLVINNDKLREIYGNLSLATAFAKADDILTTAAKGIAEIITVTGYINVDFEDVKTVMTKSGVAIMGSAIAEGENRAISAVETALASPLLNDNNINGANYILLYITSGTNEVLMDEIAEITDFIQDEAGLTADIIWGTGRDESLGDGISVTLIATGFDATNEINDSAQKDIQKVVHQLDDSIPQGPKKVEEKKEEVINTPLFEEPTLIKKEEETNNFTAPTNTTSFSSNESVEPNLPTNEVEKEVHKPTTFDLDKDNYVEKKSNIEPTSVQRQNISHTVQPSESIFQQTPPTNNEAPKIIKHDLYDGEMENTFDDQVIHKPTTAETEELNKDSAKQMDAEEQIKKSQERIMRLKALSMKLKSPSGINELENEPAYLRKNIKLKDVPHSSDNASSRYTLGEGEDDDTEIRPNNSFLHDNVD